VTSPDDAPGQIQTGFDAVARVKNYSLMEQIKSPHADKFLSAKQAALPNRANYNRNSSLAGAFAPVNIQFCGIIHGLASTMTNQLERSLQARSMLICPSPDHRTIIENLHS
jgi:hypothetical protein